MTLFEMQDRAGKSGDDVLDFVRLNTVMMRQDPDLVHEVLVEDVEDFLFSQLHGKVFLKACYHNTYQAMKLVLDRFPDARYVLGYWCHIIPVEHCFLKYDGRYFDPTALLFDNQEGVRYFSLYELSFGEVVTTGRFIKKQLHINNYVDMWGWIRRHSK